jgi:hypothetical protein
MTVLGHGPVVMLEAPIPATRLALEKAGLQISDIDLFEVNGAFASVPLAWLQATGADPDRLNVNGGALFVPAKSECPLLAPWPTEGDIFIRRKEDISIWVTRNMVSN